MNFLVKFFVKMFHYFYDFSLALGFFCEFLFLLLVPILVGQIKWIYVLFYLVFFVCNSFLNLFLKNIIKQDRPDDPKKFIYSEHFSKKKNIQFYGMPSGHSQSVFFSITYLFFTLCSLNLYLVMFCVFVARMMIIERYLFHNHTLYQLLAGAIVGIFIGLIVVLIQNVVLKKTLCFLSIQS